MKSLWNADDASAAASHYAAQGHALDVALRIYSSRLLGADPRLVRHGGGNTSIKTTARLITGEAIRVIRVKGSGWDLGDIEPEGMPAMRLDALLALRDVAHMSDEDMVNAQRCALLDCAAPTPSVETLLHAWAPWTVIDHTHADPVLSLIDQADGKSRAQDLWGADLAICDYVMPGFSLAHQVRRAVEDNPAAKGVVLLRHGIFTWGGDARESYERMIEMVDRADRAISARRPPASAHASKPFDEALAARVMPVLRGALARDLGEGAFATVTLERRTSPAIADYLRSPDLARMSQAGPATPDHVLRIKPWPLILDGIEGLADNDLQARVHAAVDGYRQRYRDYFARNTARCGGAKTPLDATARVILIPGVGLIAAAPRRSDAKIAADIAETNVAVISDAELFGPFVSVTEADIFDMEYWSLEQAKLGKAKPLPLEGKIVVVTGGAGAIGAAACAAFARQGAEVVVLDLDGAAAQAAASKVKGVGFACDVADASAVAATFEDIRRLLGGVDIVVSNAGAAWSGKIGEVEDAVLRRSFELNFFAHQNVAKAAVAIMKAQGVGGTLLFNASKQALNPGPDFGPYGAPKAALIALARQYAVDYGADGIASNVVNADRIRSGLLTDAMIAERSKARGLSQSDYMGGNLLRREVRAVDVAEAFVSLALARRTTGAILTVDGGNIAAAVR